MSHGHGNAMLRAHSATPRCRQTMKVRSPKDKHSSSSKMPRKLGSRASLLSATANQLLCLGTRRALNTPRDAASRLELEQTGFVLNDESLNEFSRTSLTYDLISPQVIYIATRR